MPARYYWSRRVASWRAAPTWMTIRVRVRVGARARARVRAGVWVGVRLPLVVVRVELAVACVLAAALLPADRVLRLAPG